MRTELGSFGTVALVASWLLFGSDEGMSGFSNQNSSTTGPVRLVETPYKGTPPPQSPGWYVGPSTAYVTLIDSAHLDKFVLLVTNNGGRSWRRLSFPSVGGHVVEIYGVRFISPIRGWLFTGTGLWCTDDGAFSWQSCIPGGRLPAFADAAFGWLRVDEPADRSHNFYRTNDGGATWNKCDDTARSTIGPIPLRASFVSPSEAWSIGVRALNPGYRYDVERTRDGGCEWERVWSPGADFDDDLNAIYFLSSDQGWLGGDGPIYHSEDGGRHWQRISTIDYTKIISLCFSSKRKGWLLAADYGRSGGLFATEDGGNTWAPWRSSTRTGHAEGSLPAEWNQGQLAELLYRAAAIGGKSGKSGTGKSGTDGKFTAIGSPRPR
jgi:photosystem II stability/assembly factor-like uncharacterized protein